MKIRARIELVKRKSAYYLEEMRGLRDGGWYTIVFGLLMVLLSPLFLLEGAIILLAGKDLGLFQSAEPELESRIDIEDVPEKLRDLFSLAQKWGVGDDGERSDLIKAASAGELDELRNAVGPRMGEIALWLKTLSEEQIRLSDTAGLFLYLMDAYEQALPDH